MYGIFTLDGLDQIVETKALARKEANDLNSLGCQVWCYQFPQGFDIEGWAEDNYGKRPTRKIGARLVITRLGE
jgi:hypothetical protein